MAIYDEFLTTEPLEPFFVEFCGLLEDSGISYAILGDYKSLPAQKRDKGDIDILVCVDKLQEALELLSNVAARNGSKVLRTIDRRDFVQCRVIDIDHDRFFFLQIDFMTRFIGSGRHIFDARRVLYRRVRRNDFYAAHPVDAALLSWFKHVLAHGKRKPGFETEIINVSREYIELVEAELTDTFGRWIGYVLAHSLRKGNLRETEQMAPLLRLVLRLRTLLAEPSRYSELAAWLWDTVKSKYLARTGSMVVAIIGPDGCGKSTVAGEIFGILSHLFLSGPPKHLHLRPGLLPRLADLPHLSRWRNPSKFAVTNPHDAEPSGDALSLVRLLYYVTDYIVGYYATVAPHARWKRSLMLFERYYYDFIVDPKRARIGLSGDIAMRLLPFVPKPDLVVYLDAPPEVLYERKKELPLKELQRQVNSYLELVADLPNAVCVDATKPIADLVHEICRLIIQSAKEAE